METMGITGHGIPPPLGRPHPFRSIARVNPVMVNATYDRRHFEFADG